MESREVLEGNMKAYMEEIYGDPLRMNVFMKGNGLYLVGPANETTMDVVSKIAGEPQNQDVIYFLADYADFLPDE